MAFFMDRFGIPQGTDWKTLMWASRILRAYQVHIIAGTPRQRELTKADWELIKWLGKEEDG